LEEPERTLRDVIDDIMVSMDMLERELARLAREEEKKGRIMGILYWMDRMRDLLVELKVMSERRENPGG